MIELSDTFIFDTMLKSSSLLGLSAGMLGVVISYQRRSIEINALAAGSFVGILVFYLLAGVGIYLSSYFSGEIDKYVFSFTGSIFGALFMIILLNILYKTDRLHMHIIQSLMTAVMLGVGITLITYIRQTGGALDSGIEIYLFGETTSLTSEEFDFLRIIAVAAVVLLLLYFRRLKIVIFNTDIARTTHFHVSFYYTLINIMVICLVAFSIKIMGVFLTVAIFLIPAVTARLWSNRLFIIMILAGVFGAVSGALGTIVSGTLGNMTLGIAITLILAVFFLASLIISPYKGLAGKLIKYMR